MTVLPPAENFDQDPRVAQLRDQLKRSLTEPLAQGRWGFVLYGRDHPRGDALPARVLGAVTVRDSVPLTQAMIAVLPRRLWIAGDPSVVGLLPLDDEPELLDEPAPAVLLRIGLDRLSGSVALGISASDLAAGGMVFLADQEVPPHGWPL
jgi:hypothetical protein